MSEATVGAAHTASDPGRPDACANVARLLDEAAAECPQRPAVRVQPSGGRGAWREASYAELRRDSHALANALAARGVRPGDRACVFVRPGPELLALTYALFRIGAVPVLADPGMGRRRLLAVVEKMAPRVFLGISAAHLARQLFRRAFRSCEHFVTVGRKLGWSGPTYAQLLAEGAGEHDCLDTSHEDEAAILFTSGSTGPPKGVLYTHGMFTAQAQALQELYAFEPGEVDLCGLPLFALFDVAFRMTSVFPDIDPSRPGRCDPGTVVRALEESSATTAFGSPAIWRRVVPHLEQTGGALRLRRVLTAGAPIPVDLIRRLVALMPDESEVHTPYGATEALPVASISGREVLALEQQVSTGRGTCVGRLAPGIELGLIEVGDDVHETFPKALEGTRPEGAQQSPLGEVCVRGPVVTQLYAQEPEATAGAKMRSSRGPGCWHRMGDVGFVDDQQRLWLTGRKAHRLFTARGLRMPVPTENVFNAHPRVHRSALVGVGPMGDEEPVLVVELEPSQHIRGEADHDRLLAELRTLSLRSDAAQDVRKFLIHEGFPVDVRHNAKIHREQLKVWANAQLGGGA